MKKFNPLIIGSLLIGLAGCSAYFSDKAAPSGQVTQEQNASVASKPTNILWIYIEDQNNWNNAYGDYTVSTPTIKAFADSGVRFNHTIMPAPVCSATRSALITGAHQAKNGLHNHRSSRSNYAPTFLPENYKTVAELFSDAGYATFNIGKDDYNFKYDRSKLYNAHKTIAGFQGALDGAKFDWAKELKNKPFFGQIQLKGGKHHSKEQQFKFTRTNPDEMKLPPYYPDGPAHRKEWAQHYDTQVMSDIELDDILKQLKDNGILENTAVFWFSDHGMILLRHKQVLYEESVHVPFIVNWPAGNDLLRKKGAVRDDLMSGLDIPATSLALAGIEIPDYYDGKNIFADDYQGHEYIISAKDRMDYTFDRSRSVRSENFRYIRNFMPERSQMQPQYRDSKDFSKELVAFKEAGKLTPAQLFYTADVKPVEELYDLNNDPHQIHNLADNVKYAAELKKHRQVLLDWIAKVDDKGAYPESDAAVREVLDMTGDDCVSPECESYRKRYADTLDLPANQVHPEVPWPAYLPKPKDPVYKKVENIYNPKKHK